MLKQLHITEHIVHILEALILKYIKTSVSSSRLYNLHKVSPVSSFGSRFQQFPNLFCVLGNEPYVPP